MNAPKLNTTLNNIGLINSSSSNNNINHNSTATISTLLKPKPILTDNKLVNENNTLSKNIFAISK